MSDKLSYLSRDFAKFFVGPCVSHHSKIAFLSAVSFEIVVIVMTGHPLVAFGKEDRYVISFPGLHGTLWLRYKEFYFYLISGNFRNITLNTILSNDVINYLFLYFSL